MVVPVVAVLVTASARPLQARQLVVGVVLPAQLDEQQSHGGRPVEKWRQRHVFVCIGSVLDEWPVWWLTSLSRAGLILYGPTQIGRLSALASVMKVGCLLGGSRDAEDPSGGLMRIHTSDCLSLSMCVGVWVYRIVLRLWLSCCADSINAATKAIKDLYKVWANSQKRPLSMKKQHVRAARDCAFSRACVRSSLLRASLLVADCTAPSIGVWVCCKRSIHLPLFVCPRGSVWLCSAS